MIMPIDAKAIIFSCVSHWFSSRSWSQIARFCRAYHDFQCKLFQLTGFLYLCAFASFAKKKKKPFSFTFSAPDVGEMVNLKMSHDAILINQFSQSTIKKLEQKKSLKLYTV